MPPRLQLTFAILKPHIIKNPQSFNEITSLMLKEDFKIVQSKIHLITGGEAAQFYEEHHQKFFYNRLITFMTSGPSGLYLLARENAVKHWRTLMGPTKVFKAQFEAPQSIRGTYGLSDTRNAAHGSDSLKNCSQETKIFFPEFKFDVWFSREEPAFREGRIGFCEKKFVHFVC